jgi:prepilin-type N-terminal cleavage/methylation domain-containing protein
MVTHYKNMREQGFTLVEILFGLIIAAALAAIAIIGFQSTSANSNATALADAMKVMASAALNITGQGPDKSGATVANLLQLDEVPALLNSAGTGYEFGELSSTLTVAPGDISGGTSNAITVTADNISKNICVGTVQKLKGVFSEIDVNSTTVKDAATPNPDATDLATACGASATNTIEGRGFPA